MFEIKLNEKNFDVKEQCDVCNKIFQYSKKCQNYDYYEPTRKFIKIVELGKYNIKCFDYCIYDTDIKIEKFKALFIKKNGILQ